MRAGARLLMEHVSFRVAAGDKVGLVGRNGAGKTTLTRILAGEALPAAGTVRAPGEVGYLPQDPRTGDPEVLARDRILSARGLDDVVRRLREAEVEMGRRGPRASASKAMKRYERADAELHAGGGYAAEAEAAQIAASLSIEDRILDQPLRTLSGGQRRRVELARILFSGAETLLLDEPTNHLDADSIVWLRELPAHPPGRADRDQPRRRAARGARQQGVPPRRQPGRGRRLQHGLVGVPHPARDRRAAPQARARQRRAQGRRRSWTRPTRCGPRRPRRRPRSRC